MADEVSNSQTSKDERPVVLITTVDIGGGKTDRIEMRLGDSAEDVARAFCKQHGVPEEVIGPLTLHLKDHLNKSPAAVAAAEKKVSGLWTVGGIGA
jgi:hypothetical protein